MEVCTLPFWRHLWVWLCIYFLLGCILSAITYTPIFERVMKKTKKRFSAVLKTSHLLFLTLWSKNIEEYFHTRHPKKLIYVKNLQHIMWKNPWTPWWNILNIQNQALLYFNRSLLNWRMKGSRNIFVLINWYEKKIQPKQINKFLWLLKDVHARVKIIRDSPKVSKSTKQWVSLYGRNAPVRTPGSSSLTHQ